MGLTALLGGGQEALEAEAAGGLTGDNAIEASSACGGACREIRLLVALKNKTIVIQMKNPVTESVNVERLATNKKEPIYHGFGVISMRQLAAKYGGEVVFSCEKGIFTTSIVINNFEG